MWQETCGWKYPYSDHAPGCNEYKQEEFAIVEHDGMRCVMELREAAAMLAEAEEQYKVNSVFLTRDQFDRMLEFQGF
jgi:hypothetical protein